MFAFHPELFEHRALAIETLAQNDYNWLEHFSSVCLIHDLFGLEVCGIVDETDAPVILAILQELFPDWPYSRVYYHEYERDRGWKVMVFKNSEEEGGIKSA
ncbi:MAG TPA: hypothetical protein VG733_01245 [Chthoniobacteraceae bacterium]|nr:hypothetical protein [Chthoniobacteraceae bacterium]